MHLLAALQCSRRCALIRCRHTELCVGPGSSCRAQGRKPGAVLGVSGAGLHQPVHAVSSCGRLLGHALTLLWPVLQHLSCLQSWPRLGSHEAHCCPSVPPSSARACWVGCHAAASRTSAQSLRALPCPWAPSKAAHNHHTDVTDRMNQCSRRSIAATTCSPTTLTARWPLNMGALPFERTHPVRQWPQFAAQRRLLGAFETLQLLAARLPAVRARRRSAAARRPAARRPR
jgi:hypothetical protein